MSERVEAPSRVGSAGLGGLLIRRPLLSLLVLGAAALGVHEVARRPSGPTLPTLAIHAPVDASEGEVRRRIDDAILIEEGLRLGWVMTDPVIRDRLVRNLRFIGEAGDDAALIARALELGMERTDLVVRQRLIARVERLLERSADREQPSDADLAAHLAAHRERFVRPARVRLGQIFLSRDRRGAALEQQARALVDRLAAGPREAFDRSLGDPLPTERPGRSATHTELARDYGEPFADAVFAAPVGRPSGPFASPFGLHLVLLRERAAESTPTVAEARAALTESWRHGRREEVGHQRLTELRARCAVQVDRDLPAEPHLSAAGEQ